MLLVIPYSCSYAKKKTGDITPLQYRSRGSQRQWYQSINQSIKERLAFLYSYIHLFFLLINVPNGQKSPTRTVRWGGKTKRTWRDTIYINNIYEKERNRVRSGPLLSALFWISRAEADAPAEVETEEHTRVLSMQLMISARGREGERHQLNLVLSVV